MGNKLKIHISFYIFLFFVIYFNGFSLFLSYFIALFLHEISHYFLSKRYSKLSQTINIYPFGMNVCVNLSNKNTRQNILIFLIGPMVNILLLFFTVALWWQFPITFFYTLDFALANFCLGFFNLIPIYPLDGGNMILQCFGSTKSKMKVLKIMRIFAIVFASLFLILFIISCFNSCNFSCFCVSIFLYSSLFTYDEIFNNEIKNCLTTSGIKEYKAYVITLDTKYDEIKKCFDKNNFVQFYVVGKDNKVVKVFTQEEIKSVFLKSK